MDKMKPDQERVRTLLTDTVTLLCKNGLQYSKELKVQGLLGITLDNDDVFVVHINEIFNGLLGAQVSAIRAEDTSGSAIAAADSATSDVSLKSRKGIPQKYECPSPSASNKRKARPPTMSPMVHVKKERVEDDIVIMDSKSLDSSEFNDEIGEGDREAMRKSYGEMLEAPSSKRRLADSSGSFRENQSQKQSGPFVTGTLVRDTKETLGESDTIIEDSSLDDSSSGLGPVTDGQTAYDNSAGCSAWDGQETGQTQSESAQDSTMLSLAGTDGALNNLIQSLPKDLPSGAQYIVMNPSADPNQEQLVIKLEEGQPNDMTDIRTESKSNENTMESMTKVKVISHVNCNVEGCNCAFSNISNLKRHMDIYHNDPVKDVTRRSNACGNKPYKCAMKGCDRAYYNYKDLRRHLKGTHNRMYLGERKRVSSMKESQNKPYKCPFGYCFGEFETVPSMKNHVETMHSLEDVPAGYYEKTLVVEQTGDLKVKIEGKESAEGGDRGKPEREQGDKAVEVLTPMTQSISCQDIKRSATAIRNVGAGTRRKGRYVCTFSGCGQSYHLNNSLVRHMRVVHNLMAIVLRVMRVITPPDGGNTFYQCKECLHTVGNMGGAVKHYHTNHGSLPRVRDEDANDDYDGLMKGDPEDGEAGQSLLLSCEIGE